jgi:isopentenyldiphosphate isomerase
MAKIVLVDERDEVIGAKERDEIVIFDRYRVSALWATNPNTDILLARRAFTKSHDPGKWGPAVAGTVEEGENYLSNILKEAREELGLADITPQLGPKIKYEREHSFFCQWFTVELSYDQKFLLQKEEVAEVAWFPRLELIEKIKADDPKFLVSSKVWLNLFLS